MGVTNDGSTKEDIQSRIEEVNRDFLFIKMKPAGSQNLNWRLLKFYVCVVRETRGEGRSPCNTLPRRQIDRLRQQGFSDGRNR